MIIMSQDERNFVIIGRGTTLVINPYSNPVAIASYYGSEDSATILGEYKDTEEAEYVLNDIYNSIGEEGAGKYHMPSSEEIDAEFSRKRMEQKRKEERRAAFEPNSPMMNTLSVRTFNCLTRAGYYTLEEICNTSEDQLSKVRNLGPTGLKELREKHLTKESAVKKPDIIWEGENNVGSN